ncbi:hypothetical protein [Microcoleus sp.]|uniref:hypothetical protein n=1 Tax=Microcoleus sp. TaxID=44472 RepID=UPI00352403EC
MSKAGGRSAAVVVVPGSDAGVDTSAGAIEKGAAASTGIGGGCVMMGKPHECECQTPP